MSSTSSSAYPDVGMYSWIIIILNDAAFSLTIIIHSLSYLIFSKLLDTFSLKISATPFSFVLPPEYITLYPSLLKSSSPFHLTSPNPIMFMMSFSFFSFIFSRFPVLCIVRTFHVPILISSDFRFILFSIWWVGMQAYGNYILPRYDTSLYRATMNVSKCSLGIRTVLVLQKCYLTLICHVLKMLYWNV